MQRGTIPYIPFKSNSVPDSRDSYGPKSEVWTRIYHFYSLHREEFLEHYHKRGNVETTFNEIDFLEGEEVLTVLNEFVNVVEGIVMAIKAESKRIGLLLGPIRSIVFNGGSGVRSTEGEMTKNEALKLVGEIESLIRNLHLPTGDPTIRRRANTGAVRRRGVA